MCADDESALCEALFRGLVFFLGREVPREALLLVIRCADWTRLRWAVVSASHAATHALLDM